MGRRYWGEKRNGGRVNDSCKKMEKLKRKCQCGGA